MSSQEGEDVMDVILALAFGTCLHEPQSRPGKSNTVIADTIARHIELVGKKHVFIVSEEPITVALNSLGYYPDQHIFTSLKGNEVYLDSQEFIEIAVSKMQQRSPHLLAHGARHVNYWIATHPVRFMRAREYFSSKTGLYARELVRKNVPCDPAALPWHTRSFVAAYCFELMRNFVS